VVKRQEGVYGGNRFRGEKREKQQTGTGGDEKSGCVWGGGGGKSTLKKGRGV